MAGRAMFIPAALLCLAACGGPGPTADALPACATPQPVASRTYMVFFDHGEATLTARAHEIIGRFRSNLSVYDRQRIELLAGTDTSEAGNLARLRGEAVAVALREEGLPGDATIAIVPLGRDRLLVPTPENTPEPQNRNVVLVFRGGQQARPTWRQVECREWLATHRCGPDAGTEQAAQCSQVRRVADEFRG